MQLYANKFNTKISQKKSYKIFILTIIIHLNYLQYIWNHFIRINNIE